MNKLFMAVNGGSCINYVTSFRVFMILSFCWRFKNSVGEVAVKVGNNSRELKDCRDLKSLQF